MEQKLTVVDTRFSTTRRLLRMDQLPEPVDRAPGMRRFLLVPNSAREGEGGLRLKGYFKKGAAGRPLISIITTVYNGIEHIEKSIESVIGQTYDNIEYIIIDGGSTDGTFDVIQRYNNVIDYWVSEPDDGVYDAMNKALRIFRGDYVLFLGCDDILHDVLHEVVSRFDKAAKSYYGNVVLSSSNTKYDGRFYSLKLFLKNIPHQAIFYSRKVFEQYRFDTKYRAVADYALNLTIFHDQNLGFRYIPGTIATYNDESGVSVTLVDRVFSADKPGIIKNNFPVCHYIIYRIIRALFRKRKAVIQ